MILALGIFLLALLGTPLFAVLALAALCAFSYSGIPLSAVSVEIYRIASWPTLMAIPLFTVSGHLLAKSQSPARLIRLARASFGHFPAGIATASLVVCALFTAFTGASGVTIIALGGLLYPVLKGEGYSERFSLGLLTTSGSLGLLFPPSLPIILYGLVAKVDIDDLFLAGIVPGIVLMVILSFWSVKSRPIGSVGVTKHFDRREFILALKGSVFELLLPLGVLVGIYGGYTTVGETSTITAFYVLVLSCWIHRDLSFFKDVPGIIHQSMSLVGAILLILCCAMGLTSYLVDEEIPTRIFNAIRELLTNKYSFLLFLNIFLLVVGAMMDIFSAIIVVVPLIVPIANEFGIHPIHLAIIFLTNMEIGFITPPIGINLFISSVTFKSSVTSLYRACFPFFLLLLLALMVVTYVPFLSLLWVD